MGDTEKHFELFWQARPRRKGEDPKKMALVKFIEMVAKGNKPETLIFAVKRYRRHMQELGKENSEYVPMTKAWLHQQRFLDYADANVEIKAAPKTMVSRGKVWTWTPTPGTTDPDNDGTWVSA